MGVHRRFKVALTDPNWNDVSSEKRQLGDIADVRRFKCRSEAEVIANCSDADALLVTYAPLTQTVIASLKNCRVISVFGIGVDMVDVQAATAAGIYVTNVPGYCIEEVCDHAMALLLAAARKVVFYHRSIVEAGQWSWQLGKPIYKLRGKTLGLVGFGKISRAVAERARSFGLRVLAFDPYVGSEDCERAGARKTELEELLAEADFVSVHVPLTQQSRGLIGVEQLRGMKRTATIVNTSRGAVINQQALVRALQEGWIAGAALDVLENEPPEADNPLMGMDNVILNPHAGFYSEEGTEDLRRSAALEVRRVLTGEQPENLVNRDVLNLRRIIGAS
ncbi:MAG: C-terminal binding protein [Spirochaetales bacterium]|nr:C-terminal binding protein [Spirochaetales bacterium]